MIKGKPYKRINRLRVYKRTPIDSPSVYSLWTPDLTECIYYSEHYKDVKFIANNITCYINNDNVCESFNYSDEYLNTFQDKDIIKILHNFNNKHNIKEILYEDENIEEYIKIDSEFSIDIDKLKDGEIYIKYER